MNLANIIEKISKSNQFKNEIKLLSINYFTDLQNLTQLQF